MSTTTCPRGVPDIGGIGGFGTQLHFCAIRRFGGCKKGTEYRSVHSAPFRLEPQAKLFWGFWLCLGHGSCSLGSSPFLPGLHPLAVDPTFQLVEKLPPPVVEIFLPQFVGHSVSHHPGQEILVDVQSLRIYRHGQGSVGDIGKGFGVGGQPFLPLHQPG